MQSGHTPPRCWLDRHKACERLAAAGMEMRLQVLLDDGEYDEVRKAAERHGLSMSEWVRRALRRARRSESRVAADRKLGVVRAAVRHEFPTPDVHQSGEELARGTGSMAGEEYNDVLGIADEIPDDNGNESDAQR